MRRVVLVVYLSAVLVLGGCASSPPAAGDNAGPCACESTRRPKWVQYDWLDEHPLAKTAMICGLIGGFVAGGLLIGFGYMVALRASHGPGPVTLP